MSKLPEHWQTQEPTTSKYKTSNLQSIINLDPDLHTYYNSQDIQKNTKQRIERHLRIRHPAHKRKNHE